MFGKLISHASSKVILIIFFHLFEPFSLDSLYFLPFSLPNHIVLPILIYLVTFNFKFVILFFFFVKFFMKGMCQQYFKFIYVYCLGLPSYKSVKVGKTNLLGILNFWFTPTLNQIKNYTK